MADAVKAGSVHLNYLVAYFQAHLLRQTPSSNLLNKDPGEVTRPTHYPGRKTNITEQGTLNSLTILVEKCTNITEQGTLNSLTILVEKCTNITEQGTLNSLIILVEKHKYHRAGYTQFTHYPGRKT